MLNAMTGFIALKLRSLNNNGKRPQQQIKISHTKMKEIYVIKTISQSIRSHQSECTTKQIIFVARRGINVAKAEGRTSERETESGIFQKEEIGAAIQNYRFVSFYMVRSPSVCVCVCVVSEKARPLKQTIHSCTHTHARKWPPNEPST